jgi:hypothetical protein
MVKRTNARACHGNVGGHARKHRKALGKESQVLL